MNISKPCRSLLLLTFSSLLAFSGLSVAETTRVSVYPSGAQTTSTSYRPDISADGRYVAFESESSSLVAGDTNGRRDIFLRDTQTGTTTRVSVSSTGVQATEYSRHPAVSANGRYVVFASDAPNLVAGDTNGAEDIFLHDTQTGATTLVSVSSAGAKATNSSRLPAISANGRYVVFGSYASNLVAGDTNGTNDIFLRDTQAGATTRVSVSSAGMQTTRDSYSSDVSNDGRYVVFNSGGPNLVAGDTNNERDTFLHNTQTGNTTRISVSSAEVQGTDGSYGSVISNNGHYVVFSSDAPNLVAGDGNGERDIFLRNTQTGLTSRISVTSTGAQMISSHSPAISDNGRYVVFISKVLSLVGEHGQLAVFLRDTQTNTTIAISKKPDGSLATGGYPSVSDDGRRITFDSGEALVAEDSNGRRDVFMQTLGLPGDCDIDGDIDVDDVLCTTDLVLDGDAAQDLIPGDCNADLFLDITDVTCTINKALD